jgi:Spy/CpxP family protein refolding chaperone
MRARGLILICLVAVGVSLGVTWAVHAVRGATSSVREDPLAQLDLEPEQRLRILELVRAYHPRLLKQQEEVEARRARLADVLVERGGDAAALEACLREVAEAEAELDREVVRNLLLLKPHLTPEQQAKLFRHIELRHPSVESTSRTR